MAPHNRTDQPGRAGARGYQANPWEKRVLVVGSLVLAFIVGTGVGLTAGRGRQVASVPTRTSSEAQVNTTAGELYLLSPPNEHDPDVGDSDVPVRHALVGTESSYPFLLSPSNERDSGECGAATVPPTPRLSPPNETNPGR
jgi:hypothetical protein